MGEKKQSFKLISHIFLCRNNRDFQKKLKFRKRCVMALNSIKEIYVFDF